MSGFYTYYRHSICLPNLLKTFKDILDLQSALIYAMAGEDPPSIIKTPFFL